MPLIKGTYVFNDTIDVDAWQDIEPSFGIEFISAGVQCCAIDIMSQGTMSYDDGNAGITVYSKDTGWVSSDYMTIVVEEEQEVPYDFYGWLLANTHSLVEIAGTWIFNDTIDVNPLLSNVYISNEFESNGINWQEFVFYENSLDYYIEDEDENVTTVTVYTPTSGWVNDSYKTITFAEGQNMTKAEYDWLSANATSVIASVTYCGEEIAMLSSRRITSLHTKGKMMEDDLTITLV